MNLVQYIHDCAERSPLRPAIALGNSVLYNYRQLADRVAHLGTGFMRLGLEPGEKVGILIKNTPEYFECLLASWHAGLAVVPINAKLHAKEFNYILEHAETSLCLASPGLGGLVDLNICPVIDAPSTEYRSLFDADPVAPHQSGEDELAWLFYTSGTTGRPKGAMLSHRNLETMCACYLRDIDNKPPWNAILHPAPLSHGSGLYALPHFLKGSCQILPESGGFEVDEIFPLMDTWPGCVFFAAPTMIRRLVNAPGNLEARGLKTIIYGGAPMYLEDIKACIARFGPRLAQLYGQGESPMTITGMSMDVFADSGHPDWEARVSSAGRVQSAVEVKTVDADGNETAVGEIGEVIVKGPSVMLGYWNDPQATASTLRNGWLWTGDMGSFDEHGFLTLKDRSKDVIISGGSNIYPREVEEVLLRHPDVDEVSVIGRTDPQWGEAVVAYVVATKNKAPNPDSLDRWCLDHIARFKRPRHYRFIDDLPKNNYGKILKTRLREMEEV